MFAGAVATGGYECKLTGPAGVLSPAPLHDWQACTSGANITGLPQGNLLFQVRAAGESGPLIVPLLSRYQFSPVGW